MLDIENQPLLPSDLYDLSYIRRELSALPKPRLRKMGRLWWCRFEGGNVSAAAFGKDAHEAYATCMRMLGFEVPMGLPRFVPPTLADLPVGVA